ncbi:MAG: toll/interleukin-1 receptor domain-containing protein [Dissulfurispiraceae bacterium]
MIPKEIFLSHSSRNRIVATRIAETLRSHGVPVWFSPTNIITAQQWQDEIGKALRRCDWFMVLLSNAAINSKWVKRELSYALSHSQYDNHIISVKIGNCDYEELSWTLGAFQMVELTKNREEVFTQILLSWGLGFDINKMS